MLTMRKLLLLLILAMFTSNCQTQPGLLTLAGGAVGPIGNNPEIGRTTSSSESSSGVEITAGERLALSGTVVDAQSEKPVQLATVFHNGTVIRTGADGKFELKEADTTKPVLVKASGYRQTSVAVSNSRALKVALKPFDAK